MNFIYLITSVVPVLCILACILVFIRNKGIVIKTNMEEWPMGAWVAGIFVAGIGASLLCGTPRDLIGYIQEGYSPAESIFLIIMYNGLPVWSVFAILGLWYIKHPDNKLGKVAAMASTVLGMAVSLWTGTTVIAKQFGISDTNVVGFSFVIAGIIVLVAILSAYHNWLKTMSKLSMYLFLMACVCLIFTPQEVVGEFPKIVGKLLPRTFREYFMSSTGAFWWAWWMLWSPTIARWLAHISSGKTVRQYIVATAVSPTIITILWVFLAYKYMNVIMNFNVLGGKYTVPTLMFITASMVFMSGSLDSDCRVFSDDLNYLTKGKLKQKSFIPYYSLLVLIPTGMYNSGLIRAAYSANFVAGASMIFIPFIVWELVKIVKSKGIIAYE